jgi:hypothetical protein
MSDERKYGVFAYWSEDFQEWKVFGLSDQNAPDVPVQVYSVDKDQRVKTLYALEDEYPALAGKIQFIEIPYMTEYARNKD